MKKTEKTESKPTVGRAAFIHELKSKGARKADAFKQAQEKFRCAKSLFERIWARDAKSEAAEEPKKKTPKAQAAS